MDSLVPAFKNTIFSPTYELATEYAEIGIDAVLESGALKEIPICQSLKHNSLRIENTSQKHV